MADDAYSTPAPSALLTAPRPLLEATAQRFLDAAQSIFDELNRRDGDPDLEDGFDQEAVCEGEGDWDELEPDGGW